MPSFFLSYYLCAAQLLPLKLLFCSCLKKCVVVSHVPAVILSYIVIIDSFLVLLDSITLRST